MATSSRQNFSDANSSSISNDPIQHEYCQFIPREANSSILIDLVDSSDDDSSEKVSLEDSVEKGFQGSSDTINKKISTFINLMDSSSDSDKHSDDDNINRSKSKKIRKKLTKRKKNATTVNNKTLSSNDSTNNVQEPRIRIDSSSDDEEEWSNGSIVFVDNSFDSQANVSITTISDDSDDVASLDSSDEEESQLDGLIKRTRRLNMADSEGQFISNGSNNKENDTKKRKPKKTGAKMRPIAAAKPDSRTVNNNRTPQKCKDFRKTRESLTSTIFQVYNKHAFDGKLDSVKVVWSNKLRTTAGLTRLRRISKLGRTREERLATIELSLKVLDDEERLRSTLLHEMVHCAAWIIDGVSKPPHGSCFKKWARIAMKRIPGMIVTTTHDYEIQYKYAWACIKDGCSFVVKRHSRSIDVSRQCCGLCRGKLVDVEVPTSGSSGNSNEKPLKPTPRKRATPSAYNLFVKEQSKIVRGELTNEQEAQGVRDPKVSQSDVMKECARRWREKKLADTKSE